MSWARTDTPLPPHIKKYFHWFTSISRMTRRHAKIPEIRKKAEKSHAWSAHRRPKNFLLRGCYVSEVQLTTQFAWCTCSSIASADHFPVQMTQLLQTYSTNIQQWQIQELYTIVGTELGHQSTTTSSQICISGSYGHVFVWIRTSYAVVLYAVGIAKYCGTYVRYHNTYWTGCESCDPAIELIPILVRG